MLEMIDVVRQHSKDQVLVIAGAKQWSFDNNSLIELDSKTDDTLIMYNYHAYMNPDAPKALKNTDSLEKYIKEIQRKTDKPVILTEFGQFCCETNGSCGLYEGSWDGKDMGYAEAVVSIAQAYGASWTPWAWRPGASQSANGKCQDVNEDGHGLKLRHPTDNIGPDWQTLWEKYGNAKATFPKTVQEEEEQVQ